MKFSLLFVLLLVAVSMNAQQSLKDALYGGKLKTDSGTVIRKGEDLSTKIDTSTRKPVEVAKPKPVTVMKVDSAGGLVAVIDSTVVASSESDTSAGAVTTGPKDNNKVWKEFMDQLTIDIRREVMPSKKVKDGAYSVLIEYEIGTDGTISVNNVSTEPGNSFIEQQVRERIILGAPQLTPLLGTTGKPRKAVKKQTITLTK